MLFQQLAIFFLKGLLAVMLALSARLDPAQCLSIFHQTQEKISKMLDLNQLSWYALRRVARVPSRNLSSSTIEEAIGSQAQPGFARR
jgi:hypothetical protein